MPTTGTFFSVFSILLWRIQSSTRCTFLHRIPQTHTRTVTTTLVIPRDPHCHLPALERASMTTIYDPDATAILASTKIPCTKNHSDLTFFPTTQI